MTNLPSAAVRTDRMPDGPRAVTQAPLSGTPRSPRTVPVTAPEDSRCPVASRKRRRPGVGGMAGTPAGVRVGASTMAVECGAAGECGAAVAPTAAVAGATLKAVTSPAPVAASPNLTVTKLRTLIPPAAAQKK